MDATTHSKVSFLADFCPCLDHSCIVQVLAEQILCVQDAPRATEEQLQGPENGN